jgi:hypothetical protein
MKTDNYSEKTSEARNEAASVHKKSRKVDYTVLFKNKNYSMLDSTLSSLLDKISLSGRAVVFKTGDGSLFDNPLLSLAR